MAKGKCAVGGCDRGARTRGWCQGHYQRWWKTGDVGGPDFPGRQKLTEKLCPSCKELLPRDAYGEARPGVIQSECRPCWAARGRRWRADNPELALEVQRRSRLKQVYGLTPEDYDAMFEDAACSACSDAESRLVLDHDHDTGQVRGVLCSNCNVALGLLNDSPERILELLRYIGHNMSTSEIIKRIRGDLAVA